MRAPHCILYAKRRPMKHYLSGMSPDPRKRPAGHSASISAIIVDQASIRALFT